MKTLLAAIFLAVPIAAFAQDAPTPAGTSSDPKVDAIRAELSERARGACMNDLATILAQRNDAMEKLAVAQKTIEEMKKAAAAQPQPAPTESKPPAPSHQPK